MFHSLVETANELHDKEKMSLRRAVKNPHPKGGALFPSKGVIDKLSALERMVMDPIHLPIDGVLDLHMFAPKDATSVVDEYLRVCIEKGIYEVRIIHGKGKGVLRRTVHAFLEKHPCVLDFGIDSGPSSWGATIVHLKYD